MKKLIFLLMCSGTVFAQSQNSPANYKRPASHNTKLNNNAILGVASVSNRGNQSTEKFEKVSRNYKIPVSQKSIFDVSFNPVVVNNEQLGLNYRASLRNYKNSIFSSKNVNLNSI